MSAAGVAPRARAAGACASGRSRRARRVARPAARAPASARARARGRNGEGDARRRRRRGGGGGGDWGYGEGEGDAAGSSGGESYFATRESELESSSRRYGDVAAARSGAPPPRPQQEQQQQQSRWDDGGGIAPPRFGGPGGGGGGGMGGGGSGGRPPPPPGAKSMFPTIAAAFLFGIGAGVSVDSAINIDPNNIATREVVDQMAPNRDICLENGYSAMVMDTRVFLSLNPFNVYISQPEVKPGCVMRPSNWRVLEKRDLLTNREVSQCQQTKSTFGFVGDINDSPEVSCIYHSEDAENQFLRDPTKALMGDGFQPQRTRMPEETPGESPLASYKPPE